MFSNETDYDDVNDPARLGKVPTDFTKEPTKKGKHMKARHRWGKLECLQITSENMEVNTGRGTSRADQWLMAYLKCTGYEAGGIDCKQRFFIMLDCIPPKSEVQKRQGDLLPIRFPGKRVMRDCGCMGRKLGGPLEYPKMSINLACSMPEFMHMRVDKLAQDRIEKMSEVIRELISRGLNHVDEGGDLTTHFQGRGTKEDRRISMGVKVSNVLMKRIRECVKTQFKGAFGLSTVAMALIDLGLDLVEEERERDFREAHQKKGERV